MGDDPIWVFILVCAFTLNGMALSILIQEFPHTLYEQITLFTATVSIIYGIALRFF
jgi:hypothetical protein